MMHKIDNKIDTQLLCRHLGCHTGLPGGITSSSGVQIGCSIYAFRLSRRDLRNGDVQLTIWQSCLDRSDRFTRPVWPVRPIYPANFDLCQFWSSTQTTCRRVNTQSGYDGPSFIKSKQTISCCDPGVGRASTRGGGGAGRGGEAMRPGRVALFPFGYLLCLARTCCKEILFVRVVCAMPSSLMATNRRPALTLCVDQQ